MQQKAKSVRRRASVSQRDFFLARRFLSQGRCAD